MIRQQGAGGTVYYQFSQWTEPHGGPLHGVFTRLGGVSKPPWASLNVGSTVGDHPEAVRENKARLASALGLKKHRMCTVWQVHGNDTIVVNGECASGSVLAQADGIVTDQPDVALTMRFADCVPILFFDPVRHVIGIAHAGWRGTVDGAGPSVVKKMVAVYGCEPQHIQAGIGPSIGPARYQVGQEVVDAVRSAFGHLDGLIHWDSDGAAYFDLWEANHRALEAEGLAQVEVAELCTATHTEEFFSHRAERGRTGRFGAVIALPPQG